MSTLSRSESKLQFDDLQPYDQEDNIGGYCSLSSEHADSPGGNSMLRGGGGGGGGGGGDQEKRIRREIANSNERRRMQSINAGFQSLRTLLPHHEGEKLSKAAILQQTAEYIYQLEQEKTRLLSQNCQLKRLINQQEGESTVSAVKKRKTESGAVMANNIAISESSDEGIGPMSPEPLTLANPGAVTVTTSLPITAVKDEAQASNAQEMMELRVQLDRERGLRMILEDQIRSLETQLYPDRIRDIAQQVQLRYQDTDECDMEDDLGPSIPVEILSVRSIGARRSSQTTNVSSVEEGAFSDTEGEVITPDLHTVAHTETVIATPSTPSVKNEHHLTQTPGSTGSMVPSLSVLSASSPVSASTSPAPSVPSASVSRLPSILEAAIKAEPKVEVERLPSSTGSAPVPSPISAKTTTMTSSEKVMPQARVYLASTSRQNLETIVEAIRHLEGDHLTNLFSEGETDAETTVPIPSPPVEERTGDLDTDDTQDAPLALTKHATGPHPAASRILKVDVNPFLQFHTHSRQQQQQQQRPGVIVVKHT
nr:PREDICTED: helix-loop-helix protein 11-like isoform X2 [Bemisia tabaci]